MTELITQGNRFNQSRAGLGATLSLQRSIDEHVLSLVRQEPGELVATDLAARLNYRASDIRLAVRRLTRRGDLLPRGLRVYANAGPCSWKVPAGMLRCVCEVVETQPGITRAKLAARLGVEAKNGNLNRALSDLHLFGYVAPARSLWPAPEATAA